MSARPGTVQQVIQAATALGAGTGFNIPLNNEFAVLYGMSLLVVATATVGNRVIVVQARDAGGRIIMQTVATTAITGGQTSRLLVMPGTSYQNIAAPISQVLPWPNEMALPRASSIQILDNAAIDNADTVAANITLAA